MPTPIPPPPAYPAPKVSPLQVGSPEARAAYEVMSGSQLVVIEEIARKAALPAAVRLAKALLDHTPAAGVMFLADTVERRRRYAARLRRQFDPQQVSPFTLVYQGDRPAWIHSAGMGRAQSVWVASPDQPRGRLWCDVMIVLPDQAASPMTVLDMNVRPGQVVVLGEGTPGLMDACRRAAGRLEPTRWGDIPLDVVLAGAPK